MKDLLDNHPVTTLLIAIVVIAALAGAVVTIVHPDTLPFATYLDRLEEFAKALGLLAIGKGIKLAGDSHLAAQTLGSFQADTDDTKAHA